MILRVMMVLGARPQFIKSAPVVHELLKRSEVTLQLVNSGQHYDYELSRLFFEQLKLPRPALDLRVGSGSHAVQTGRAMMGIENCVVQLKPDIILVPGDTNTTLAAALAGAKLNVPVGHIEAGARSYDMRMPEEINRKVTDHISAMLFAPTTTTVHNLQAEGIASKRIFHTGDTLVDALTAVLPAARKMRQTLLTKMDLNEHQYLLVTAHRPANVDIPERLTRMVKALRRISRNHRILFPAHPRILSRLKSTSLYRKLRLSKNITLSKPLGYLEMIAALETASAVLTDSGGLQKEAFLLGTPCITMREVTEWPETLRAGANKLVDLDTDKVVKWTLRAMRPRSKKPLCSDSPFGSGRASERIVRVILSKTSQLSYAR